MSAEKTIRDVAGLVGDGLIAAADVPPLGAVADRYAIAITPEMAALIDRGAAMDPIARQFVPSAYELATAAHELGDPTGDAQFSPLPGIVHRHPDRVLLKATHLCPVYCRFCFRRERVGPGKSDALTDAQLDAAIAYIAGHPEIWEVILTGGDPLILSPRRIGDLNQRLSAIAHVKVVRWHTRVPVVDPVRVDDELVAALACRDKTVAVAVHANHAREFTQASRRAIARLRGAGIMLLSQTVLLAGVNDTVETLHDLMRAFVECGVRPYYLHQLDPAPGTSHFHVPLEKGLSLVEALRRRASGLCQPLYVIDNHEGEPKQPVRDLPNR